MPNLQKAAARDTYHRESNRDSILHRRGRSPGVPGKEGGQYRRLLIAEARLSDVYAEIADAVSEGQSEADMFRALDEIYAIQPGAGNADYSPSGNEALDEAELDF